MVHFVYYFRLCRGRAFSFHSRPRVYFFFVYVLVFFLNDVLPIPRNLSLSRVHFAGEDKRPKPEQRGWGLLHSGWRTRFGHAGGLDRVLLQVPSRGETNEGGTECTEY